MGKLFTIPPSAIKKARDGFDDLIDQLGKPCLLVYESTATVCPNCIIDPNSGKSSGRYKAGGPQPFSFGDVCPVCDGEGKIAGTEMHEEITLGVNMTPKGYDQTFAPTTGSDPIVNTPSDNIRTKGYVTDLPRVTQASYLIVNTELPYINAKYVKRGGPFSPGSIVRNRYFFQDWRRYGA